MQQKEIKVEVERNPPTSIVVSSNATKVEEKLESEKSKEKKQGTVLLSTNQKTFDVHMPLNQIWTICLLSKAW